MCGEFGEVTAIIGLVINFLALGTLLLNSRDTLSYTDDNGSQNAFIFSYFFDDQYMRMKGSQNAVCFFPRSIFPAFQTEMMANKNYGSWIFFFSQIYDIKLLYLNCQTSKKTSSSFWILFSFPNDSNIL